MNYCGEKTDVVSKEFGHINEAFENLANEFTENGYEASVEDVIIGMDVMIRLVGLDIETTDEKDTNIYAIYSWVGGLQFNSDTDFTGKDDLIQYIIINSKDILERSGIENKLFSDLDEKKVAYVFNKYCDFLNQITDRLYELYKVRENIVAVNLVADVPNSPEKVMRFSLCYSPMDITVTEIESNVVSNKYYDKIAVHQESFSNEAKAKLREYVGKMELK